MSYDNTLKYWVEQFPEAFAQWLVNASPTEELEILKTELTIEPIRADGVMFLRVTNRILHLEFQTSPQSDPPIPRRMLNYWFRLYNQYECEIEQVVIFLKPTTSPSVFVDEFREQNTSHRYRVIRIWELEPELFLDTPSLLPLAVLAKTEQPRNLLAQIAQKLDTIEDKYLQRNISGCIQLLAGINFQKALIKTYFREELMKESVIYQEIIEEANEKARIHQASLIARMVKRYLGNLNPKLDNRIQELSLKHLDDLGIALFDFKKEEDVVNWLNTLELS